MLEREKIPKTVVAGTEPIIIEEPKKGDEVVIKVCDETKIEDSAEPMQVMTTEKGPDNNIVDESALPDPVPHKTENIAGLSMETATDCMICGNPFMQDWQHKEYNMCPSCRKKLNKLLNGE